MARLQLAKILDYFDGPNIIEARDVIGGNYVGVWIKDGSPGQYVVFGVSPEQLRRFRGGDIDLLELMSDLPQGWYYASFSHDNANYIETVTENLEATAMPKEFLPLPGFFLTEEGEEVTLLGRLVEANRDSGGWILETPEGTRSGSRIEGGPAFSEMVIDRRYRFHCIERMEATALGPERSILILTAYEPLSDPTNRTRQLSG